MTEGVSFVIPVLNGRRHLRKVLNAVARESAGRRTEIIVVDDGSTDGSEVVVESVRKRTDLPVRCVAGPRRGAAAALNVGIRHARYSIVAQIDQDVVIGNGWLRTLLERLEQDDRVAAAQGCYVVPSGATFWARMSGRDLDVRYMDLRRRVVDHVCTGNTVYRTAAIAQIGGFDERLGYGYDNDSSYRLADAGWTLAFCPAATADHYWREGLSGYLRQQYGVGYGRLDLVRAHPRRWTGDAVSGFFMMAHAPLMLIALALAALSIVRPSLAMVAAAVLAGLALERAVAGVRAWRVTSDRGSLFFPLAHLARDVAWAAAIVSWTIRQAAGGSRPADSMPRRQTRADATPADARALVLIPAYNEAVNLPSVIQDLRTILPAADVLVINDASTDETASRLPALGVQWLTLAQRVGVGGAQRAGVRYAGRRGYTIVGRLDGDGQHRAVDLRRLVRLVSRGRADAAIGSRYSTPRLRRERAVWQRLLSAALTLVTRTRVTDPTSGIWAFGSRVLPLLEEEHPGGYPEPELRLLLARHRMRVLEVGVPAQDRQAGRTSLTPVRSTIAFARTAIALLLAAADGLVPDRE